MRKVLLSLLTFVFLISGCSKQSSDDKDQITLRLFSNVPDRTSGRGLIEQMIIDNYMKDNPNIKIEVEALPDEQYKQKLSAYSNSTDMPDILNHWSTHPAYSEMAKQNKLYEFDKRDFESTRFFPGALDSFTVDEKLFGLPYTNDFMALYLNTSLFEKFNIDIPTDFESFISASIKLRENGVEPLAISGMSPYLFGMMFNELFLKNGGKQSELYEVLDQKTKVAENEHILEAVRLFEEIVQNNVFNKGFITSEYGVSQNLFIQGKAAMYYSGSWESSLDSDEADVSDDFRKQVKAISLPVSLNGDNTNLTGWYGGGYVVNNSSRNLEESVDFIKYMMSPNRITKLAWEENAFIPSMSYEQFMTGKETNLQKDLTTILEQSKGMSGTPISDYLSSKFKDNIETLLRDFSSGEMSRDQFIERLQVVIDEE